VTNPIVFSSKGAHAYAQLRRSILMGELEPGARVAQYELAEKMGMSITPLREAIRQLAAEGLVDVMAHRDVRVSEVSAQEARQLLEARLALEPVAARLAAQRRSDAEMAAIDEAAARLVPVTRRNGEAALEAHRAFHRAVYAASGNDVVTRMLDELWDKSDRYRRLGMSLPAGEAPRTEDFQQHHDLARLVREGAGDAAEALARAHIRESLSATLLDALEGGGR